MDYFNKYIQKTSFFGRKLVQQGSCFVTWQPTYHIIQFGTEIFTGNFDNLLVRFIIGSAVDSHFLLIMNNEYLDTVFEHVFSHTGYRIKSLNENPNRYYFFKSGSVWFFFKTTIYRRNLSAGYVKRKIYFKQPKACNKSSILEIT